MTLATKNNAIIVKDGKLAEDCGCCGDWYCCPDLSCLTSPSSVSVSIAADDYYAQYSMRDNLLSPNTPYQSSACLFGACMAGVTPLSRSPSAPAGVVSEWSATYQGVPAGCAPATVVVRIGVGRSVTVDIKTVAVYYASPSMVKQKNELTCSLPALTSGQGAFVRRRLRQYSHSIPVCASQSSLVVTNSFEIEENRDFVDSLMLSTGAAANSWGQLAANRSSDEKYGAVTTAINSRTGSNLFTVTVTITA